MHLAALKAHGRHHEGAVAVELAVDVATTVLLIPGALFFENVIEERIGTELLLLRERAADVAAARVHERGEVEQGEVAELRIAATVLEHGLRSRGIDDGHARGLGLGRGLFERIRRGSAIGLGSLFCLPGSLVCRGGVVDGCRLGGNGLDGLLGNLLSRFRLSSRNLGRAAFGHARGHTVELAHAGEGALDLF